MPKFKKGEVVATYDNEHKFVVIENKKDDGDYALVMHIGDGPYLDNYPSGDLMPTKQKPWAVAKKNIDGFGAIGLTNGKKRVVFIGCRTFLKPTDAKRHWANDERGTHWNEIGINPTRAKKNNRRLKATLKLFDKLETM